MDPIERPAAAVTRVPIHFGVPGRPLFGFYHPPPAGSWRGVGVVLASPFGTDQTRSSRTYRHLAERLAAAGFACLRFDPFGTGDSGGDAQVPELVRAWIDDIGIAAAELQARSGAAEIALVGLRLGATLALAHAAERGGVASLVLWNPCVSGAAFVTEVTRLHQLYLRMEPQLAAAPPSPPGGVEALGTFVPTALRTDLEHLDALQAAGLPAHRTLVIDGGNLAARDGLMAHLSALGAAPELRTHLGHKFLTTVSHGSLVPHEVLDSIVGWLSEAHPLGAAQVAHPPRAEGRGPADERPIAFGPGQALFGIVTPADPAQARPDRPPIVIANAGCVNRAGPHRTSVQLARRLAKLGFEVLRLDLSGIGDSPALPGVAENLTYPPSALAELELAIDALGAPRAILAGLCSGGDYAFQLGAHSARIAGAFLLNPRTFCVLDLAAVEAADGGAPPTTPVAEVPRSLRAMVERGVDTLLVVSRNDPGVAYVDARAGEEMRALASLTGFRRVEFEGADHTFTPVALQERVSDLLAEHVTARFG